MASTPQYPSYQELLQNHQGSYISYENLLSCLEWQDKRIVIINKDGECCTSCGKSESLQVHHTFYVLNYLPWEYSDNSLITLCNDCHSKLHKEQKIPVYKTLGGSLLEVTPCTRCKGIGKFRTYKHIERGICFRCRGERYEELIGKGLVSIETHQIVNVKSYELDNTYRELTKLEYYGYEPDNERSIDKADRLYGIPDPRLVEDD